MGEREGVRCEREREGCEGWERERGVRDGREGGAEWKRRIG